MYCPSCGSEIAVELKYCNRCGVNLSLPAQNSPTYVSHPIKLTLPSIVLGLTIISGLGIIFGGAGHFALLGVNGAALVWIILLSLATLFGCTALMIRFWTKLVAMQRETLFGQPPPRPSIVDRQAGDRQATPQFPPRLEPVPSVTENTTRTFSPIYREPPERGTR